MAGKTRLDEQPATAARAKTRRIYATMARAGARYYVRPRDLPKLIALWPYELEDASEAGGLRIIATLAGAPCRAAPRTVRPLELRFEPSPWSGERL
jgi:hypothetical protein